MFYKQVAHLKSRYRCVVYDHRGQGRSQVTEGGYDMDALYADAVGLIEALDLGPCHFAGLSMGGFVGMRVAARRPDLLKSLILMDTSCQEEPFKQKYNTLVSVVKLMGIGAVAGKVMPIMFGTPFLEDKARASERKEWHGYLKQNKKTIVRAVQGVIDRKGIEDELPNIQLPTLVMVGTHDVATVPEKAAHIHELIAGSTLVHLEGAGHTASI